MDMVERVVKAIEEAPEYGVRTNKSNDPSQRYEIFYLDDDDNPVVVSAFSMSDLAESELRPLQREALARAAIKAMREPTKEMNEKGAETVEHFFNTATLTWQAMIDAALRDA